MTRAATSVDARPRPRRPSAFAGLWVSAAAGSFARTAVQLALGWITLEATGSLFMVGVVAAVRMAPQIPLGIPAGIVADWFDRRRLVVAVAAASAVVTLGVSALAAAKLLILPIILAVALAVGLLDSLRTITTQAYAYDLVRASRAARGLAFVNLGAQLLGTAGGLLGGYTLEAYGAAATFLLVAAVLATGATLPWLAAGSPATAGAPGVAPEPSPVAPKPERPSLAAASTLILRNRLVGVLALTIVIAEVLGFTSQTLLPTFARDVFQIGAAGLGMLTAARSIGGVVGLILLSRFGTADRSGAMMLGTAGLLGLALLAFASTPSYELALLWLALVGAACAVLDTLSQMLLQQSVGEGQRGAAMGIWVFSIGFAPLGHLALGALADTIGAPLTQALFGATLTLIVSLLALYPPLRNIR